MQFEVSNDWVGLVFQVLDMSAGNHISEGNSAEVLNIGFGVFELSSAADSVHHTQTAFEWMKLNNGTVGWSMIQLH